MRKVGIIGIGNMGYPIYKALVNKFKVAAFDPYLKREDVNTAGSLKTLIEESEILILCVKPDKIVSVLKEIHSPKIILSIAAGITLSVLRKNAPENSKVVRLMPNLPLQINEGCTAYIGDEEAYPIVKEIFESLGLLVPVASENLIDAATGLAGSGPAYVFSFVQGLAEGGVKSGLTYKDSLAMSIQTIKGSIALLEEELKKDGNIHPYTLRNRVTSPGGTTIYGLNKLEENGFQYGLMEAVFAAYLRAGELGKKD